MNLGLQGNVNNIKEQYGDSSYRNSELTQSGEKEQKNAEYLDRCYAFPSMKFFFLVHVHGFLCLIDPLEVPV